MKRNVTRIGVVLLVAFFAVGLAAWRHGCHRGNRIDRIAAKLTKELSLTADQKAKLDALQTEFKAVQSQAKATREANHASLVALVTAPELDTAKLSDLLDVQRGIWLKARPGLLAKLADFHHSLTDDQKKKLAVRLADFAKNH